MTVRVCAITGRIPRSLHHLSIIMPNLPFSVFVCYELNLDLPVHVDLMAQTNTHGHPPPRRPSPLTLIHSSNKLSAQLTVEWHLLSRPIERASFGVEN